MSALPFYITDVSGKTLNTVFGNDSYKTNDTNTYHVGGSLRFNLDGTMNVSYRVRSIQPPLYINGDWEKVADVVSQFFKIENIQPESPLGLFIQQNDDEVDEETEEHLDDILDRNFESYYWNYKQTKKEK